MATIRVLIKDKNFKANEIKRIQAMSSKDTEALAKRHETVLRHTIENVTAGGTGKLANAEGWTAEPIVGGWGLGDVGQLDSEVNYWRHQNYGSEAIGANWQHYLPKGFWVNGRWVVSDNGFSGIQPKSPIPALNYIEKSIFEMETQIPQILSER
ncbi:MAG TPA: hypothetical protein VMX17_10140 [Candidatus Glassbacteria bacterium]|nr:hypothetical protein [Candidatus Glassbacteria bacterium]